MADNKKSVKIIAQNKKAYHDYFVDEKYEAGVELLAQRSKVFAQDVLILRSPIAISRTVRFLLSVCI